MEFAQDLKTALKKISLELNKNNLEFCLAGGWAVSILGIVRGTVDIDLLIILDENIKEQVVSILKNSFNLIQSHENEMEFKNITIWRNIVSLKGKKDPIMIDFMKADNGYLKSVIQRSIEIEYEGSVIPVISIEDLIVVKLKSYRKQDQVDIENLLQSQMPIDWDYLEKVVKDSDLDWSYIEQSRTNTPGEVANR